MAQTPEQCLARLRTLFKDAYGKPPVTNEDLLAWAKDPEHWAEQQIRHKGWSFYTTEAVVRSCRVLRRRAALAIQAAPEADA